MHPQLTETFPFVNAKNFKHIICSLHMFIIAFDANSDK